MAPTIKLYTFPASVNAVRTELALLEKGLEFEKVLVDLFKGEHKQPPLADITPRTQVPTLSYTVDGEEIIVYESIATIRFLDDMHPDPPLMPPVSEPARRAKAIMRIEEFQAKLDPANIMGSVAFGKQTREQLGKRVDNLLAEIPRWETYLADDRFLAGGQFTLADIAVFPVLVHFEALGYDYPSKAPKLAAYMDRMKARPSVLTSGWIDAFGSFAGDLNIAQVLAD
jgi:glutathione S-transferase